MEQASLGIIQFRGAKYRFSSASNLFKNRIHDFFRSPKPFEIGQIVTVKRKKWFRIKNFFLSSFQQVLLSQHKHVNVKLLYNILFCKTCLRIPTNSPAFEKKILTYGYLYSAFCSSCIGIQAVLLPGQSRAVTSSETRRPFRVYTLMFLLVCKEQHAVICWTLYIEGDTF